MDYKQLINGQLVTGEGKALEIISPITGKKIADVKSATKEQTELALESAKEAFKTWSKTSLNECEEYIKKIVKILDENKREIKDILISETGKSEAIADYDYQMLPDCLNFFIGEAKRLNGDIVPDYDNGHIHFLIRKPIGVCACHLAWNFPILNIAYKLGPILASGCTCVLKPSSKTPLASLFIAKLINESGLPKGVVNVLVGSSSVVSKVMNESKIPSMITLIGSSETGRKVISQSATSIKNYSLELGGNAPVVVMKDADAYDAGIKTADCKFGNSGQTCVAPNRIFVHKDVLNEFITGVLSFTKRITLGSGLDKADVLVGPLITKEAQNRMLELTQDAVSKGAKVICGGNKADREGFFFEPTVLSDVTNEMRVYNEEIFGPIMPIIPFDDNDDIVALANDTEEGLAAYLYTNDLKTAQKLSQEIDAGSVCVNDPFYSYQLPHGGCKESGIGKDCSTLSLKEYYTVQRITTKC